MSSTVVYIMYLHQIVQQPDKNDFIKEMVKKINIEKGKALEGCIY